MRTTLRWLIAIALLCAVAVAGCGGDDDEAESESTADGGDGDNGDGGDDGDGGGVPGSPINIPGFQSLEGGPLDDALAAIEIRITDLCGGEMCLVLDVEASDEDREVCEFSGTDPSEGGQVERGGTLVVIAGTQPCEEDQPDDGDDGDDGDTDDEPPDDDNGNTDDGTDDQPADDNDDTDDTQAPEETP